MSLCKTDLLVKFNAIDKDSLGLGFNQKTKNILHAWVSAVDRINIPHYLLPPCNWVLHPCPLSCDLPESPGNIRFCLTGLAL